MPFNLLNSGIFFWLSLFWVNQIDLCLYLKQIRWNSDWKSDCSRNSERAQDNSSGVA